MWYCVWKHVHSVLCIVIKILFVGLDDRNVGLDLILKGSIAMYMYCSSRLCFNVQRGGSMGVFTSFWV